MIELILDFVSVNAFLALHPAKSLAEELGVELKLTPMRTTSELSYVKEISGDETPGDRHRRVRAEYTRRDALRYAEVQGLDIAIDGRDAQSEIALRGLLAANSINRGFDYAANVFSKYWRGQLQVDAQEDIEAELSELGLASFDVEDPRWDLEPVKMQLAEREIFVVPTFWVDGERYMGRQHLPMIRWQLERYQGPGPL
ncbi:MAG: hypothetical protein F4W90_03180 [Gammaproteobacteria bacterium]|nr:hypothetical protein [Gammaproteobacteria bacterium]